MTLNVTGHISFSLDDMELNCVQASQVKKKKSRTLSNGYLDKFDLF